MNTTTTHRPLPAAWGAWLLAAALWALAPVAYATTATGPQVAWLPAASEADVDRAFAQGREAKKPVLMYWGAAWCPPCNQLKATLFNRQDFIARTRDVVPVYVDGDGAGAQKVGSRFKVRGYPTLILFNPEGVEITRLPGEVDPPQVLKVLELGLSGGRPVKAVLADAQAGKPLSASEWKLLAWYSWDTDEAQLVPVAQRPGLLVTLSAQCPRSDPGSATRLLLKALAESNQGQGVAPDAALRERVRRLLADPAATRAQMDVLVNAAPEITRALAPTPGPERVATVKAFDAALQRLQADASFSRADHMTALNARVELARLDEPKDAAHPRLPTALRQQVREAATRADREITDGYERQAVITTVAYTLAQAGLWTDSDSLLKANLAKSHSPYYLMSELASNARRQGRSADALDWYGQAYAKSQGPATRLQWGASYVAALVDLAPQEEARIEQAAAQVLGEAQGQQAAFFERSGRALQKVGAKLAEWNGAGRHAAVVARLRARLAPVCAQLPAGDPQRGTCEAVIKS